MDVAGRTELCERVTATLRADPRVTDVRLGGSLVNGKADEHSDIDLVAMLDPDVLDRDFFLDVPRLMGPIGPAVPGWGFQGLPDTYIATIHFDDQPLFWSVDVACISERHVDGADLIAIYRWEQIYKMWIHAAKYAVRGDAKIADVARLTARHIDIEDVPSSSVDQLAAVLDAIGRLKAQRGDPYEAFHARCVELCNTLRS